MASPAAIRTPQLLQIAEGGEVKFYGANQTWYATHWQRQAGCGPTTCSHLLWYLSRTRQGSEALCAHDGTQRSGFIRLMEEVWQYVTPGMMGVNNTSIFTDGAVRYGLKHGVKLSCRLLEVSAIPFLRPKIAEVNDFLTRAMADDLPVAFLNLSNGALRNLDNWHWVTLVSADPQGSTAQMYDQGISREINLDLWLRTTSLGGGFVAVEPEKQEIS